MEIDFKNYIIDKNLIERLGKSKNREDYALAALDHINMLEYQLPPDEPECLKQFKRDKQLPEWVRKPMSDRELIEKRVHARAEVTEYLEIHQKATVENLGNACWLAECIESLVAVGLKTEARKFWEVYNAYPTEIWFGPFKLWTKRRSFK